MFVGMGDYYNLKGYGLVKTVAKAKNCDTKDDMVMFATVGKGGVVTDMLLLNEKVFLNDIVS